MTSGVSKATLSACRRGAEGQRAGDQGRTKERRPDTHIIQPDVDVHLVHEPAETLVRLLCLPPPLLVRVQRDDGLAHVDDAAQQVGKTVEVFDDELELGMAC